MADLKLTVDSSQLKSANEELGKSLTILKQQLAFSKRMEAQKAKEAKSAASAASLVAKEEERLKNKFVEGYTAMNIYTKEMNDLAVARKKGIIGTKEQTAAVAQLNAQMKAGTGVFANAATGMQIVGKRANRTGMLAQQAGYQFGDFAVQVQSGTDPMVAFGQQATQLIGTFSMLAKSTKAIMAFSALGVIVPIITAIGAALMRMKKDSDVAGKAADSLRKKMKALASSVEDYRLAKEALSRGLTADQFISRKAVDEAKANLKEVEDAYRDYIKSVNEISLNPKTALKFFKENFTPFGSKKDIASATAAFNKAEDTLAGVEDRLAEQQTKRFADKKFNLDQELALQQEIAKHGSDSSRVKALELEQEIASRHRVLEAQRKSLELRGYDVDALKKQAADTLRLEAANRAVAEESRAILEIQAESETQLADANAAYEKRVAAVQKERKESIAAFQEQIVAKSEVLNLLELEKQFGKDSSVYRRELIAQEAYRLNKLLDQKRITEEQAETALRLYEEHLKITGEIDASANSAKALADELREAASAMSSLLSFGAGLDKAIAVAAAKVNALKTGADEAVAGRIAGYRADLDAKLSDPNLRPEAASDIRGEYEGKISTLEEYLNQGSAIRGSKKRKAGGGADKFESELQQLKDFLATEKELLQAKFEERQDTLEMSLQKRLVTLEEFKEMELQLERKKQAELSALEEQTQKAKVSAIAGGIVEMLNAAANGNQKMLKMARVVGAAEALINTYRAAALTLADSTIPFYTKFAAVASVVASGLSMVSAIKSGSSSGSASGSAATMPAATQAATPQRVVIEGIDRNSLITGDQLSNIFDALYKENEDRGLVFEVAR